MPRIAKIAPAAAQPCFRPEALKFLRSLARHNDREWFTPRKAIFEAELKEPMLAVVRKAFTEFEGNALTRPPKGFPCEHPALDLVRCRQWGLSATLPPEAALKPDMAAVIIRHFRLAAPIVDALNTPIAAAAAPKKK